MRRKETLSDEFSVEDRFHRIVGVQSITRSQYSGTERLRLSGLGERVGVRTLRRGVVHAHWPLDLKETTDVVLGDGDSVEFSPSGDEGYRVSVGDNGIHVETVDLGLEKRLKREELVARLGIVRLWA